MTYTADILSKAQNIASDWHQCPGYKVSGRSFIIAALL